ncbi:formate dehydrogenase subunit gamma [Lichenicoccus sp.]|uniref:formate dehydrogenase subunit gamma n=1 Tax=Lichenicoccus sp. TaxID=2781899 RepID=UPI003D0B3B27
MSITQQSGWPETTRAQAIIEAHLGLEGPLLPILHALQDEFRCVPSQAEPLIASALNISRAELHGVISFYHDFRRAPAGRHVLKLCRAEACQSMGAVALAEALLARLGLDWSATTADGELTIEPTYCLGLCACAPAALLDDTPMVRLTSAKLDDALAHA